MSGANGCAFTPRPIASSPVSTKRTIRGINEKPKATNRVKNTIFAGIWYCSGSLTTPDPISASPRAIASIITPKIPPDIIASTPMRGMDLSNCKRIKTAADRRICPA